MDPGSGPPHCRWRWSGRDQPPERTLAQSTTVRDGKPRARNCSAVRPRVWVTLSVRATILVVMLPSGPSTTSLMKTVPCRLAVLVQRDPADGAVELELVQGFLELCLPVGEVTTGSLKAFDRRKRCRVIAEAEERGRRQALGRRPCFLIALHVRGPAGSGLSVAKGRKPACPSALPSHGHAQSARSGRRGWCHRSGGSSRRPADTGSGS